MAESVYILCAATSLVCAVLLARAYWRARTRLLLWSSLCFGALAVNAILLVLDLIVFPVEVDLRLARVAVAAAGMVVLLGALIAQGE